jgi:hypothetical protein
VGFRSTTEVPQLLRAPWHKWLANLAAGAGAILLGLTTGEWVFPSLIGSPKASSTPGSLTAGLRFGAPLDGGAMGLTLWATTVVLVTFNLLAMFLFATILVPLVRRWARQSIEDQRDRYAPAATAGVLLPASPSRDPVMTGRDIRLQGLETRNRLAEEQQQQQKEEMLRRIFESNLSLHR